MTLEDEAITADSIRWRVEKAATERPCDCGWPDRAAKNPAVPVIFDEEMNEYNVAYGPEGRSRLIIRYCPWCGGKLPESRRASFFTEPDPAEVSQVERLMSGVRDIPTMLRMLGEPDSTYEWSPFHDEAVRFRVADDARWKRQFHLSVQVAHAGTLGSGR